MGKTGSLGALCGTVVVRLNPSVSTGLSELPDLPGPLGTLGPSSRGDPRLDTLRGGDLTSF
jgi:hypothetical protein